MPDFRFRLPAITDLTDAQQIAYYEQRPILITGGPGSGKTVVSIFRYLLQIGDNQNAKFFTYNRTLMSAVRGTLRQRADILLPELNEEEVETIIQSTVGSIFEWYGDNFHATLDNESDENIKLNFTNFTSTKMNSVKYTELFIDESQDLRPGIISATYEIAQKVTCGADRSQDIRGHYVGPADDEIYKLLVKQKPTVRQELTQNFRNTKEIFEFARQFVPEDDNVQNLNTSELNTGEKPDIRGGLQADQQYELILEIIKQNPNSNIGILLHSRPQIIELKQFLESRGYSCSANAADNLSFSYYYSGMSISDRKIVEHHLRSPFILTYESCKGLEFDIVVMPFFEKTNWALSNFKPSNEDPDIDANGNPKTWTTPNHYYVACTRARSLLYVLFNAKPDILSFWQEDNRSVLPPF